MYELYGEKAPEDLPMGVGVKADRRSLPMGLGEGNGEVRILLVTLGERWREGVEGVKGVGCLM